MNNENKIIFECLNTFGRVPEQWELLKMIKELQSNWNSLREWLESKTKYISTKNYGDVLEYMNELEGKDKEWNIK